MLAGQDHPKRLGDIATHPYLARQNRLTFKRIGKIDPLSLEDYQAHDGFKGSTTRWHLRRRTSSQR